MQRLFLMLLSLSASTIFLLVPRTGPDRFKPYTCPHGHEIMVDTWELPADSKAIDFFLFSDTRLFVDTWVWLGMEHSIIVLLAIVIFLNERTIAQMGGRGFVLCATVFLGIHLMDTIFYYLSYGDPFRGIKVTWNIAKVVIFGYAIRIEAQHRNPVG